MIWRIIKWSLLILIIFILCRLFIKPSNEYRKEAYYTIKTMDIKPIKDSADIGIAFPIVYGTVLIQEDSTAVMTVNQFKYIIGEKPSLVKYNYYFDRNKKYYKRTIVN